LENIAYPLERWNLEPQYRNHQHRKTKDWAHRQTDKELKLITTPDGLWPANHNLGYGTFSPIVWGLFIKMRLAWKAASCTKDSGLTSPDRNHQPQNSSATSVTST